MISSSIISKGTSWIFRPTNTVAESSRLHSKCSPPSKEKICWMSWTVTTTSWIAQWTSMATMSFKRYSWIWVKTALHLLLKSSSQQLKKTLLCSVNTRMGAESSREWSTTAHKIWSSQLLTRCSQSTTCSSRISMELLFFVPFLKTVMMTRGSSSSSKSGTTPRPWEWIEMAASCLRIASRWSESNRLSERRSSRSSSWRSWKRLLASLSTQAPSQLCQTTNLWSSMSLTLHKKSSSMTCWPTSLVTM